MWHHLFLEFWLVGTWFLDDWRHQRAVTRLENVLWEFENFFPDTSDIYIKEKTFVSNAFE